MRTPHPRWSLALQGLEYGPVLSGLTHLPAPLAHTLAGFRGRFNAHWDRDWVSLALGHRHVAEQAFAGYRLWLDEAAARQAVRERFETVAREELEARLLARAGLDPFRIDAADALQALAARPPGQGVVLATAHLETFVLGIAALASTGEKIHPVMSSISADPRLHPAVRAHFVEKYRGLQALLNGGELADAETRMRHFYQALQRGEVVVVIADAPALPEGPGVWLDWLGRRCQLAQGALRLARTTGSLLAGFVTTAEAPRRCRLRLSALRPAQDDGQPALQAAVDLLSAQILTRPGRWWASHLLPVTPMEPPR